MKVIGPAAKTVFYLKKIQGQYPTWTLHYKIKCKSTENELTNFFEYSEIKKNQPVAIIAREQFSGVGQNSKTWVSPKGGIWLSAAYPIFSKEFVNVLNYTPSEGISLSKVLQTKNINQHYWTAKVLKAFNDSIECNKKKEYVIKSANKFLTKSFLPSGFCPHTWKIKDIDSNGNLRIENETQVKVIRRF